MATKTRAAGTVRKHVPILSWLPAYQRKWFSRDLIAGFTVWGLLIPEGIAYATLAGMPPQAGLYTLLASLVLYAIFGTSRQLVVAGTSASAVLVFSTITALNPKGSAEYVSLGAELIIITGLCLIVAGLCKLGFITQFLSRPVMGGFIFGLAVFVTVGQLPKLFGVEKGEGNTIRQFVHLVGELGSASWTTFAVGAIALGVLFALDRVPKVPGGLVVLAGAIALSSLFHLDQHGVGTVGEIEGGLPSIADVHFSTSHLWVLLPSALGMMLVIFSESLGAGQTFADKHGYRIDASQDMIALGLANFGSGFIGGLATGGSLSQTAVNDAAGARSELSTIFAAVLSLITVVALMSLFTNLPEAVLAAMIIHAVSNLMNVKEMRRYHRLAPIEFWLGMVTLLGVITLDVLPGLVIGIAASILVLVYQASRPRFSVLGANPDFPGAYEDVRRHPRATPVEGVLIVRPDGPLFYANAQTLRDTVSDMARSTDRPPHTLILDLDETDELDITSSEALERLVDALAARKVRFGMAHVHAAAADMMRRTGIMEKVGADRIFPTLVAAVAWARQPESEPAPQVDPR